MKNGLGALVLSSAMLISAAGCAVPENDTTTAADRAEVNSKKKDSKGAKPKSEGPKETPAQENARESAAGYLDHSAFSRTGLIDQLKFEGFSEKDATYGVDAQKADWNKQAAASAESYLDSGSFSRVGLIDQLMFEGYTRAQAEYGVNKVGL